MAGRSAARPPPAARTRAGAEGPARAGAAGKEAGGRHARGGRREAECGSARGRACALAAAEPPWRPRPVPTPRGTLLPPAAPAPRPRQPRAARAPPPPAPRPPQSSTGSRLRSTYFIRSRAGQITGCTKWRPHYQKRGCGRRQHCNGPEAVGGGGARGGSRCKCTSVPRTAPAAPRQG